MRIVRVVVILGLVLSLGSGLLGCSSGTYSSFDPKKEEEYRKKAAGMKPGMPKAKATAPAKGEPEKSEPKTEPKAPSEPGKAKENKEEK